MIRANHTPAPWHVYGYEIGTAPDETIAVVCALSGNDGDSEEDANARLIAAAPELLAALETLLWQVERTDDLPEEVEEMLSDARAAIAKAKGQ